MINRRKYKVATNSDHKQSVFENKLNRQFDVEAPNQVYVGDITYIWTRESWLDLAIVIDLFPRKGWLEHAFKNESQVGLWRIENGYLVASTTSRTDSTFGSWIVIPVDNAVAESFFRNLKQERIHWRSYQHSYAVQQDVLQCISMFYNSYRLYSYLGYKRPRSIWGKMEKMKKVA